MLKKNILLFLLTSGMCLCLTSCGDDVLEPIDQNNTNANKSATAEASRLEIPRLVGGNNIFLVKNARLSDTGNEMFVISVSSGTAARKHSDGPHTVGTSAI